MTSQFPIRLGADGNARLNIPALRVDLAVGLLALLVAVASVLPSYWTEWRSSRWPSTAGLIVASQLQVGEAKRGVIPEVRYRYRVVGRDYSGTGITFNRRRVSRATGERTIAEYAVGRSLPVYYDPAQPEHSVLIRGLDAEGKIVFGIGVAVCAACLASLVIVGRDILEDRTRRSRATSQTPSGAETSASSDVEAV